LAEPAHFAGISDGAEHNRGAN